MSTNDEPLHGIDLKVLRVARRIRGVDVARAAGWTRQRVARIEAEDMPTAAATRAYLAALAAAEADRPG